MDNTPKGWLTVQIGAIAIATTQRSPSNDEEFQYVDISSIDRSTKSIVNSQKLSGSDAPTRARRIIRTGDVLLSKTRPNLNAIAIVPESLDNQIASTGFEVLRVPVLDPRWLFYFFRTRKFIDAMVEQGQGALYPAITSSDILSHRIPLAPLGEQKTIIDKLDRMLSKIESCRKNLDKIPFTLDRFKQTILNNAISGNLTLDWRNGKDIDWKRERSIDVCEKVQSGGTPKEGFIDAAGVPFLKVYNIVNQKIDFAHKSQYITDNVHDKELLKSQAFPGDVLMNIVGPPLGKVGIVPDYYPSWNINQALVLFRPSESILSKWIYYILCSGEYISEFKKDTRGSAGQINISLSQCREFVFPVPPIEEQIEIIKRIDKLFAHAELIEKKYLKSIFSINSLINNLLEKAFSGDLTDKEEPEYEPVEILLERILKKKTQIEVQMKDMQSPEKPARSKKIQPVRNLGELAKELENLGGKALPLRLLKASGLEQDIDLYFQLLKQGRDEEKLIVPVGENMTIKLK